MSRLQQESHLGFPVDNVIYSTDPRWRVGVMHVLIGARMWYC